jgi:hypothetical protein
LDNSQDQHTRGKDFGDGPQYLKIVGKVLYPLKDIEAYEEACLIPERVGYCSNDLESV